MLARCSCWMMIITWGWWIIKLILIWPFSSCQLLVVLPDGQTTIDPPNNFKTTFCCSLFFGWLMVVRFYTPTKEFIGCCPYSRRGPCRRKRKKVHTSYCWGEQLDFCWLAGLPCWFWKRWLANYSSGPVKIGRWPAWRDLNPRNGCSEPSIFNSLKFYSTRYMLSVSLRGFSVGQFYAAADLTVFSISSFLSLTLF